MYGWFLFVLLCNVFSYFCFYFVVDIDFFVSGCFDLFFWVFKYGGSFFGKILGLRVERYFIKGSEIYCEKFEKLLGKYGIVKERMGKVWLIIMFSLFGYEGDNFLIMWYIYENVIEGKEGKFLVIVLEVYSVFDELYVNLFDIG